MEHLCCWNSPLIVETKCLLVRLWDGGRGRSSGGCFFKVELTDVRVCPMFDIFHVTINICTLSLNFRFLYNLKVCLKLFLR